MVTVGPIWGPVAGGIDAGIRSQLQIQSQSTRKQRSTGGGSQGRWSRKVGPVDASQSSGFCQKREKLVEKGNHKLNMVGIFRQGSGIGGGRQAVTMDGIPMQGSGRGEARSAKPKKKVPACVLAGSEDPMAVP